MMLNRQRTPEAGKRTGGGEVGGLGVVSRARTGASGGGGMIVRMGESLQVAALPLGGRGGD